MEAQRAEMAHLFRRAGFGARPAELDAALRAGYAATVEALLRPIGPDAGVTATPLPSLGVEPLPPGKKGDPQAKKDYRFARRTQQQALVGWWLHRMVAADHPHPEKLTLFWHGHWATSIRKVGSARLMLTQNETLRTLAAGDFRDLARAMVRDPALLRWLDGPRNRKSLPNENLSRELMELFVVGIGSYSEDDVREAARALTGWRVNRRAGTASLNPAAHDARPKQVLGRTANFDDRSLVDLLVDQPASARFLIVRLWRRFVAPTDPPTDAMARLLAAYGPRRDVGALVHALLLDPAFGSPAVRFALVKQPVEYVVSALRALQVEPAPAVSASLLELGQVPFLPPSVGGWPAGAAWLTTSAAQARLRFAQWVVAATDPARLVTLALVAPEYVVS